MTDLTNNPASKFESVRNMAEGRSGGFEIMRLRFSIVKNSLFNVEASPTIARALENVRRLEVAAQALEYNREIERLAEIARSEAAEAENAGRPDQRQQIGALDHLYGMKPVESPYNREITAMNAHIHGELAEDPAIADNREGMASGARAYIAGTPDTPDLRLNG